MTASNPKTCRARLPAFLALGFSLLTASCQSSQVVMNKPLPFNQSGQPEYTGGYRMFDLLQKQQGEIYSAVAFSGGGKRSAAFAHGALRGFRDVGVDDAYGHHRLLDLIDFIGAVSGGSFPAMHYGLNRDKSFDTFPKDFLYRDIEAFIWGIYLLPWNWEWLINPLFGTNDAMADVYDRLMFHGATYADLGRNGLPLISVNATDITNGVSFPFVQSTFDLICSDLRRFPVARAVAASNGFPILFTPITLTSHRQECGAGRPRYLGAENHEPSNAFSRRVELTRVENRYLDHDATRYVHLMDGGIADNLAMRSLINAFYVLDKSNPQFRRVALQTRRVLVMSIDGQAASNPTLGQQRIVTGLSQVFSAVSGTQIDAYNFETLLLAEQQVNRIVDLMKQVRCAEAPVINGHRCDDVRGKLIHVSLAGVADPQERERLQAIRTGLTIPDRDVDALVASGEKQVRDNPELRELLMGLDEPPLPTSAPKSADRQTLR